MARRRSSSSKESLRRGAWTQEEDRILKSYIKVYGEGKWRSVPIRTGLKRCGKSCRLRWLNYLRPGIKRGNISYEDEQIIIRLHNHFGNKWSLIAGRLPGRTDNEIKNYWNTHLRKKMEQQSIANTHKDSNITPTMPVDPLEMVKLTKIEPIYMDEKDLSSTESIIPPNEDSNVILNANKYSSSPIEDAKNWWDSLMELDTATIYDQCQPSDSELAPVYNFIREYNNNEVMFEDHLMMGDLEQLSTDLEFESWALF